ncbi:MAG: hypothetical protein KC766_06310 [Myxococcales bacterium]|nr:hypothetical protein [Myxococcales bacterium]
MRTKIWVALGACLLAAAGCSDDGDSGGGSGGSAGTGGTGATGGSSGATATPIDDVPEIYAAAQCEVVKDCYGDIYGVFTQGEDCEKTTEAAIADELDRIKASVDSGKTVYDGTKVQDCVGQLKAQGCDAFGKKIDDCEAILVGQVELGGECQLNDECAGDAFCNFDGSCPGTCAALLDVGAPCNDDDECMTGLSCDGNCVEPGGPGDRCGGGVEPDCKPGTFCLGEDADTSTAGNCRTLDEVFNGKLDDVCSFDTNLCDPTLSCAVMSVDMQGMLSLQCVEKTTTGQPCRIAVPDMCGSDAYCDVPMNMLEGTCKARPGDGEPCAMPTFGDPTCAPNTRCDGGTCRARAHLGDACVEDAVCLSESCDGSKCISDSSCE